MAEIVDDMLSLVAKTGNSFIVSRSLFLQKSAYYKALVASGMKDSESKLLCFDILSEASLVEVTDFFSQCFTNPIGENKCAKQFLNIEAGLEAASYLQIDDMMDKYSNFLTISLNVSNWLCALDICQKYVLLNTKDIVLNFVSENFQQCCLEEDFVYLDFDQIEFILKSDTTSADSEAIIFDASLKWLLHESSRFELIPKLLKNIRFELMGESELQESKTMLINVNLESSISDSFFKNEFNKQLRMRDAIKTVVALGGFTRKEFSTNRFQIMEISDLKKSLKGGTQQMSSESISASLPIITFKSSKKCRLPQTLCEHGACVVNGCLYVAGGQIHYNDSGRLTTNKVFVFNPIYQEWSSCSDMNMPRSLFYFGELGGLIYAVTGCTASNTDTPTVERYLPDQNLWEMMTSLDVRVHELAGCNYGGCLYVSGGFRGPARGHVDLVWMFDPASNHWTRQASMLKARSYHAMVTFGEKLFVLGGVRYLGGDIFEDILDGEMYDPMFDQWSQLLHLNYPASCMSSVVVDDSIMLFGGHSFVQDNDHNFVQIITLSDVQKSSENSCEGCCSRDMKLEEKKIKQCHADLSFKYKLLSYEAQGISYFGLCEMNLPKKFVKHFH